MFKLKTLSQVVAATVAASFLVGCGSSSSSGSASSDTTNVSGSVFASNVAGAKVLVTDGVNTIAGPVTTNTNGRFVVPVPNANLAGDLVFVATGGTYTDEATGEQAASGELSVMAAANTLAGNPSIHATPSSTIINKLISEHGLSEAAAKAAFTAAFGYLPDSKVEPVDATQANAEASEASKLAGVRAAGFSQLLVELGLSKNDHTALMQALAEDLIDGSVDGMNGATRVQLKGADVPADMANQFSVALMNFLNGAGEASGLNLGKVGLLKFNTKVMSENYTFELTPPMMTEVGKTVYKLKVTNVSDGSPVVAETPMLMPLMYMGVGHKHSTPHSGCTATDADGIATCTAYFLMASAMASGDVMGNWDLKFTHDSENAHFFPKVMMAMGDTARAVIKGDSSDQIPMMNGMAASRNYNLFNNGLSGIGNARSVELFISAQESMMNFPPLVDGVELNAGTVYALTPGTIVVKVSTDNSTWVTATTTDDGLWTASLLTGLVDGVESTLYVKLSVNGDEKTTTGTTGGETAAQFTVTPGSM